MIKKILALQFEQNQFNITIIKELFYHTFIYKNQQIKKMMTSTILLKIDFHP